jgi:hypothetical protein
MAQRHRPSVNRSVNRMTNQPSIIALTSLLSASLGALRVSRLILSVIIIIIIVAVAVWPDLLADWTT